jgi:hypothetical protein
MQPSYVTTHLRRFALPLPFFLSVGVLMGIIALCIAVSVERSGGFSYILDDAYIHLSIAHTWVAHSVFGVTPYEASSTSSSLLWTFILALLMSIGFPFQVYLPLILNGMAAAGVLWLAYGQFRRLEVPEVTPLHLEWGKRHFAVSVDRFRTSFVSVWLIFIVLVTSFPLVVQYGMEHSLHTLLAFLFILQAGRVILRPVEILTLRDYAWLGVLTVFLTSIRYEGLFTVGGAAVVLVIRRQWRVTLFILGLGLLVPLVYALYSVQQGWYPLPNSLIVKATLGASTPSDLLWTLAGGTAVQQTHSLDGIFILPIFALMIAMTGAMVWLRHQPHFKEVEQDLSLGLGLVTGTLLLQLMFVRFADRYYIYLYIIGLVFVGQVLFMFLTRLPRRINISLATLWQALPMMGLLCGLLYPFVSFGYYQFPREWIGASNIYEQHHQMARFLRTYYSGESVMANDIGVITYYADIHLVDIAGLATTEMARAKREGRFTSDFTEAFARERGVKIAMIYESWYRPGTATGPPEQWIRVGSWTIPDNKVAGSAQVSFYATSPAEAERLEQQLREFAPTLPPRVMVELPPE